MAQRPSVVLLASRAMRSLRRILFVVFALVAMSGLARALVKIDVDLAAQTMRVATGAGESYVWPISSGRPGHLTPRGHFRALRLFPIVYSSKYNNAPMPHSIFFYGQYAIHGTNAVGALGRQASHGCIRLAPFNAAKLYQRVRSEGAAISIHGVAPRTQIAAAAQRARRIGPALAYAPHHRARSLKDWMRDPLEDF
jgi:hypothetical protein